MGRTTKVLVGMLVVALLATSALAGKKEGGREKGTKGGLKGEYKQMARWCELTPEQTGKLEEAAARCQTEKKAWHEQNGERVKAAKAKVDAAKQAGDKEALKAAKDEMKAIKGEQKAVDAKCDETVAAALTAEQRKSWAAYGLYKSVVGRYKKLGLKDGQLVEIRQLAIAKLPAAEADRKTIGKARKELAAEIESKVLTAEQKERLAAEKPARREKGEKPEHREKRAKKQPRENRRAESDKGEEDDGDEWDEEGDEAF